MNNVSDVSLKEQALETIFNAFKEGKSKLRDNGAETIYLKNQIRDFLRKLQINGFILKEDVLEYRRYE